MLTGQIPELGSRNIQLITRQNGYNAKVDSLGHFEFSLNLTTPQYVNFTEINNILFLIPGDQLSISKSDNGYKYTGGESGLINTYYSDWEKYLRTVSDTADVNAYHSQEPLSFIKSVNSWIQFWKQPLVKLLEEHPDLNKDFLRMENLRIKYLVYSDLNEYKRSYKEYTGNYPAIPDSFYDYLKEVDLNDTTLLQIDAYKYFLTSYIYMQLERQSSYSNGPEKTSVLLDIIERSFKDQTIKNEISIEIMRPQTSQLEVNDSIIKRFETVCRNQNYIKEIRNSYNALKSLLPGNKAPDFEILDLYGKKKVLADYQGKYLLLDVWSTTCRPCLVEMPLLEKIREDLHGKKIELIAVCLSDNTSWRKMLESKGLVRNQFIAESSWDSKFAKDYLKTSGVPVYVIIDPKGIIVNPRAPSPSENLIGTLEKLDI